MKAGDMVRHLHLDGEGTVVAGPTTAPDAYAELPVVLVEWDYKDTKVRTFAPVSSLEVLELVKVKGSREQAGAAPHDP